MQRLALPILALFFLLPGSLLAQVPYNPSYFPNPGLYGPNNRALLPPSLGLIGNFGTGPGSLAIRYNTLVVPEQQRRANDLYFLSSLQRLNQAQGMPPGAEAEDLFSFQREAGHPAGFANTMGWYPPNPRQTIGRPLTAAGSSKTPATPGAR